MDTNSSIDFLLIGLRSENIYELKNAIRAAKYLYGLNPKNNDIIKEEIRNLTKHENKSVQQEAVNILRKLSFNYRNMGYRKEVKGTEDKNQ